MIRRNILPFFIFLVFSSCGYQLGQGSLPSKYQTISIPYVKGDVTGELTAALVKEIARSGAFQYQRSSADLVLCVTILDSYEENVGFRYDRDKDGELTDSIIPTETRVTALAEVSVTETCSGCVVLGPARIYASVDFDHDYYFTRDAVNIFSLGQLTDVDAAHDAVHRPLNNVLVEKIVDYLIHSW